MDVEPWCVRCILSVRFNEILEAVGDRDRAIDLQIRLLRIAYEVFSSERELTVIATRIFNELLKIAPEVIDYYRGVRRRSLDNALRALHVLEAGFKAFDLSSLEKFYMATKLSIMGNLLDTGVSEFRPPDEIDLDEVYSSELSIDHIPRIYSVLEKGGLRVLWLFDNAGESIYDIPLISIIREMGNYVVGVAKEDPGFQNDLTISDARYAGLDKYVDELVSTGYPGASIHLDKVSREFREQLAKADLVIAKGMAHYEYLSTTDLGKPVVHLLIPKCRVLAKHLGVEQRTLVALYRVYLRK